MSELSEEEIKKAKEFMEQLEREKEERMKKAERAMEGIATLLLWDYLSEEERKIRGDEE